ncbi:MAG: type II secretion system protein [bacterium]
MKRNRINAIFMFIVLVIVGIGLYFAIQKAQLPSEAPTGSNNLGEKELKDLQCLNNLRQIRHAIAAYMADHNNSLPRSLKDLYQYGINENMLKCPVGGEPYLYSEGTVTCPHPGHEKF